MTFRLPLVAAMLALLAVPALADSAMLVVDSSASMAGKLGQLHDRRAVRKFAPHWFAAIRRALDA